MKWSCLSYSLSFFHCSFLFHFRSSHRSKPQVYNFIKKETLAQMFSCELCEISNNTFFYRTPLGDCFCHCLWMWVSLLKLDWENQINWLVFMFWSSFCCQGGTVCNCCSGSLVVLLLCLYLSLLDYYDCLHYSYWLHCYYIPCVTLLCNIICTS